MYDTLGANGENWNAYGQDIFNGMVNLFGQGFTAWTTAKYGTQTLQQVQQNPNSDSSQQILMAYLMSQNQNQNQNLTQEKEKDNTMLYVLIGFGLLAVMMMGNNSNNRR